jgi:hypothetical protein
LNPFWKDSENIHNTSTRIAENISHPDDKGIPERRKGESKFGIILRDYKTAEMIIFAD